MDRERFFALGRIRATSTDFHMTVCAVRLAARVNGVSRAHGQVSRAHLAPSGPTARGKTVPIGHVTNGVHLAHLDGRAPSGSCSTEHLGADWRDRLDDSAMWDRVLSLDRRELWRAHLELKAVLRDFIREDARRRFAGQLEGSRARWWAPAPCSTPTC